MNRKQFVEIPDLGGIYFINADGEVKVLRREWITGRGTKRVKEEHIIKPFLKRNGYYHVNVSVCGTQRQYAVHILLAKSFLPNPHNKKCVNHKDSNRRNNELSNLEWASYKENTEHAFRVGRKINPKGIENGFSQPLKVLQAGKILGYFSCIKDASKILAIPYDRMYKLSKNMIKNADITVKRISRNEYKRYANS